MIKNQVGNMQKQKTIKGYSIIEIVISLFIIGVMLLVYQAAANTWLLDRNVKNRELALRIASTEMENLRALPYASLPASGPFSNLLLNRLPQGQANRTVTTFNSRTKQIVATVSWIEPGRTNTQNISLTTLITQGGL